MDQHIRKIFSVFALFMIGLLVFRLQDGSWTAVNWMMLLSSALVCLLVFRCFVYIFNFSYALACVVNACWIAVLLPSPASLLLSAAIVVYGVRLFVFTSGRVNSDSYASRVARVHRDDAKIPVFVKVALWLQCSFLYTFHLMAIYLVALQAELSATAVAGTLTIVAGTLIEGLADSQKQRAKRHAPQDFVATGLYARWRHPNYGGEILVQLGLIIAGIGAAAGQWGALAAAVVAPLYIVLLMISECGRADRSMDERYGAREDYQHYRTRSGSMLPRL